jgi:hypothetical protein
MPVEASPAQMKAELQRLNEENEELRGKVKEHAVMKSLGTFTIADIMHMRGLSGPDEVCENCKGLGTFPGGTNGQCKQCGGSGHAINHWAVLQ